MDIGVKVWYRRPENTGTKLDSRWLGPALVTSREGAHSYTVEIKQGVSLKAHRSYLKRYEEDIFNSHPIPLFYHQRTEVDVEGEIDEWEVDRVLGHKEEGERSSF